MKNFYLTTPLYYPNARPHVGSAYTTIVCDAIARYKRMCGYDVAFLTGTDEHGEKLKRAAAEVGLSPRDFVAEKRKLFVGLWRKLGIEYTHFVYTDQDDHVVSVQRLLRLAQRNEPGVIEKRRYAGRYCVFDEMYVSEGSEPVNCPNCGRAAELISEDNYFFKLSTFQDRLLKHYEDHPEFVRPDFRLNEVKSFVKSGLRDISISRKRIKWGIPWPKDPEWPDAAEQVFYVWYDALTGYLTGIGYAEGGGGDGGADFKKYWRNDESGEVLHLIGKDILRFHAVYWPAFLMAAGLPLPRTVFAHGWIYYEQDKMSKSKGNVVYSEPIVEALDSFGAPGNDALRYYLLRDTPFGQDSSFSYEGLIQRFNSDLANDLGNLVNRTVTMLNQYFPEGLPEPVPGTGAEVILKLPPREQEIAGKASEMLVEYRARFEIYDFSRALETVWKFVSSINKYLVDEQPWMIERQFSLTRGQHETRVPLHLKTVLYTAAEAVRFSAVLLYPVIPLSAEQIWKQLGCEGSLEGQQLDHLKWGQLKPGTHVGKPKIIFPRLDKEPTLSKLFEFAEADSAKTASAMSTTTTEVSSKVEQKPEGKTSSDARSSTPDPQSPAGVVQQPAAKISIDDFAKVEMRVGEVVSAERVEGAQKLLKVMVDIGTEVRQVVAGIAEHYQPEQIAGMKVVVVTNLQPRKLRGVESNGMILAASVGEQGRPVLVSFKEDVPKGAKLK